MSAWLGVVSRAHVRLGVAAGIAQLCHGKEQPLRRMRRGDWLVYYSPSVERGGAPLRAFTAIGRVEDEVVFPFDMGGGFVPFRRRVKYAPAKEVALETLKHDLALCASPGWGMRLLRGHVPLEAVDLATIAAAMGVESELVFGMSAA